MNRIIDISVKVTPGMTVWPGEKDVEFNQIKSLADGDSATSTQISMSLHSGTHIDAPAHFIASGNTIDQVSLEILIGPVTVIHLPQKDQITEQDLIESSLSATTERILFRTRNSKYWTQAQKHFQPDFVALTENAARWITQTNIKLVGIDYLSIQPYLHSGSVHQILLESGIIILEGLDMSHVAGSNYHLTCLPLRLHGTEGAPARAILTEILQPQKNRTID